MSWFAGQTAVVTGAANGIGRGVAEQLASLGARVLAVDNDADALAANLQGERFVHCPADVATDSAAQLADDLWLRHGPFTLLVNNVGVSTPRSFLELDELEFDRVFATNLRGPWFLTRQFARRLVDARMPGSIVFVSSLHDTFVRNHPHYSASKAATAMLVKELAAELGPHGIRVNAVSPGAVRTASNPIESPATVKRIVPLGRAGEPADVARMVAVLLSDEWSPYVTGTNVAVDGGLALHSWTAGERGAEAPAPNGLLRRLGLRRVR